MGRRFLYIQPRSQAISSIACMGLKVIRIPRRPGQSVGRTRGDTLGAFQAIRFSHYARLLMDHNRKVQRAGLLALAASYAQILVDLQRSPLAPQGTLHCPHRAKRAPTPLVDEYAKDHADSGRDHAHHPEHPAPVIYIRWIPRNAKHHEAHHGGKDQPSKAHVPERTGDVGPPAPQAQNSVKEASPWAQISAHVAAAYHSADKAHRHNHRHTESEEWKLPSQANGQQNDGKKTPLNDGPSPYRFGHLASHPAYAFFDTKRLCSVTIYS